MNQHSLPSTIDLKSTNVVVINHLIVHSCREMGVVENGMLNFGQTSTFLSPSKPHHPQTAWTEFSSHWPIKSGHVGTIDLPSKQLELGVRRRRRSDSHRRGLQRDSKRERGSAVMNRRFCKSHRLYSPWLASYHGVRHHHHHYDGSHL